MNQQPAAEQARPPSGAWAQLVRWLGVLVVAAATVLLGGTAHAAPGRSAGRGDPCTLQNCSSSSLGSPSSSDPTAPPTGVYSVQFAPCTEDGTAGGSPCDETPTQIEVSYPQPLGAPDQVDLTFSTEGRSSSAPVPGQLSDDLTSGGTSCGTDLQCWPWPSAMTDDGYVLNGTYGVSACYIPSSTTTTSTSTPPAGGSSCPASSQSIGVAAPPPPPASVTARSSASVVTIAWQPPAAAPPDLVGYSVDRGEDTIYTCSLDGLGPGAGTPCPASLQVADHPGDGTFSYSVSAQRLGVDSSAADVVSSASTDDANGSIAVPAGGNSSPAGANNGGTSQGASVPLATDPAGNGGAVTPVSTGGPRQVVTQTTTPAAIATSPPLPAVTYPPAAAVAKHPQSLVLKVNPSSAHTDVVPVAVLALGILSLAVAAHFLYLRVELGVVQARVAGRPRPGV